MPLLPKRQRMKYALDADSMRRLHAALRSAYGEPKHTNHGSGLDHLVATVLSQNTNDTNSEEGFRRLKRRFPKWEQAAKADEAEIADAIRVAGLANQKAKRILEILARVKADWGRYILAPLARMNLAEAQAYLTAMPGVGRKTAACVLLFAYGLPAFPVDTHILRVAKRLGLILPKATADEAHDAFARAVPDELCYPLHLLIIRHGRQTCHARKPECGRCVLRGDCPSVGDFGG